MESQIQPCPQMSFLALGAPIIGIWVYFYYFKVQRRVNRIFKNEHFSQRDLKIRRPLYFLNVKNKRLRGIHKKLAITQAGIMISYLALGYALITSACTF